MSLPEGLIEFKRLPDESTPATPEAINHNFKYLDDKSDSIVQTRIVNLCESTTFPANTSPGTTTTNLPIISGYTPVIVTLENVWDGDIHLWYVNLSSTAINWRAKNLSSTDKTVTIRVKVLYVKSELL